MACNIFVQVLALFCLIFSFSGAQQMVPAVFLFGDSMFDVGNNNYLLSAARADHKHHGIDSPTKKPTGRFSNGRNCADFVAERLGFPTSPPPYLSLRFKKNKASIFMNGVNFASSAAGIFNETLPQLGDKIPLSKQVGYYATVYEELVKELGSSAAQERLSKSVFVLVFGTTDLASYNLSLFDPKYTKQEYVNLMSSTLKGQLKRLYNNGARKFVLPGLGPVGCMPIQRAEMPTEDCNEESNQWVVNYNEKLQLMLQELQSELQSFSYTYLDSYNVMQNILENPTIYGFTDIKTACCRGLGGLNAPTHCLPISTYCSNRSEHFFWDIFHPSEAAVRIFVNTFFDGPSHYSFPITIRQLIAV